MDKSRKLSPKIHPNFVCHSHCRNTGCLSQSDLVIFATVLKGGYVEESLCTWRVGDESVQV